jgi:hypothetical protein
MSVTQDQIDALNAAIAGGTRTVVIGAKQITYRSTDELIRARNDLLQQKAQIEAQGRAKRFQVFHAGRGF